MSFTIHEEEFLAHIRAGTVKTSTEIPPRFVGVVAMMFLAYVQPEGGARDRLLADAWAEFRRLAQ